MIQRLATRKHIDLFDKIYDWSVRAITIKDYPQFFDFLDDPELNPFNEQGYLKKELVKDKNLSNLIYLKAKDYTFTDPRQMKLLLKKEELKKKNKQNNKKIDN